MQKDGTAGGPMLQVNPQGSGYVWILFAAFLIASVYGGIMIARKKYTRKNSFPFIPFLTVAYLGGMIGGVY